MATLQSLKHALKQKAAATAAASPKQQLSDTQYDAGFDVLMQGPLSERASSKEFIIDQLSQAFDLVLSSHAQISVLEIGPGPKSVLAYLPVHLRRRIRRYVSVEPNKLFASRLEETLSSLSAIESTLSCLDSQPEIHRASFSPDDDPKNNVTTGFWDSDEKFNLVIFCHSMYGMKPRQKFLRKALQMLVEPPDNGAVVIFYRDGTLNLEGLVCHQSAKFPTGVVHVEDADEVLNKFAPFIAGFSMKNENDNKTMLADWRQVCRSLCRREDIYPGHIIFRAPIVSATFTRHATALPELTACVPLFQGNKTVKNRQSCRHQYAAIVKPVEIQHVQQCVLWALKHRAGLTVIGGGHSGQCTWPHVVGVDMGAFDQVQILNDESSGSSVVAGAGCKTEDIVNKTMAMGMTVPLGSRPSVGAGLWLQGGIGHLTRLHGLSCDAIVGAVIISVDSGQVLCVGQVPIEQCPAGAVRPENETDILWAIKGAGTNFGIVISIIFKVYEAPLYTIGNWVIPLHNNAEARNKLDLFDKLIVGKYPRSCSADVYLFAESGQLHLGVAIIKCAKSQIGFSSSISSTMNKILGPELNSKTVDGAGLFDTELYMSGMHGGHGGGKTSAFKRCVFLKHIGSANVANVMTSAIQTRPTSLCYIHLLHGGGAVSDVTPAATAFGNRNWEYACVITGVWPRAQDGTDVEQAAIRWVYDIVSKLLPLCTGAYGADLGPDPRDSALAERAFGTNRPRLVRLKRSLDPRNVLAYTCPLPKAPMEPKVIILITGEHGAGKDYCAAIWLYTLMHRDLWACKESISEVTKREYAIDSGADLNLLLHDREYKEKHRPALTKFFMNQVKQRPRLREEHFLDVVYGAGGVDVLLITEMRDEAPVATFSHLVPDSRLVEVRVQIGDETRRRRGVAYDKPVSGHDGFSSTYSPCMIFDNDAAGCDDAKRFAEEALYPLFDQGLAVLRSMVQTVPDFPRERIDFRHVLNISQQKGGLELSTRLLQSSFLGNWGQVDFVVSCEAGGYLFASPLAMKVGIPLALVRSTGKIPPPVLSIAKSPSNISSHEDCRAKGVEMSQGLVPKGSRVVVVDDVLATGKTVCAILRLLEEAGVSFESLSVMVVAEFPFHHGREYLRQCGFGRVKVQSLMVFSGA